MDKIELTKKQFTVLTTLEKEGRPLTQRELEEKTGFSLGTINKICQDFDGTLISDGKITDQGLEALEPYRVKRAVFIAAGFGSRLVPVTLNTPKPLVKVKGKRIIDTLLDAVYDAGIEEVIVVRGYLAEQFDTLSNKYKGIKFLENPLYNEANNISSTLIAKEFLQNAYVLESDLLLNKRDLITKYQYTSNFLGIPCDRTDDWCFIVKDGVIKEQKIGGENCFQMVGISYWTGEDGKKLAKDIEDVFNMPGGKERYWDQVPLKYAKNNYTVEVRECGFDDIIEIDTFSELKAVDKSYELYV